MNMTSLKKSLTKFDYGKGATRKKKQQEKSWSTLSREALSKMKTKLILKELKKSKITDRDIDIAKRLHEQYPEYFSVDAETTRRRISFARSNAGREKKANELEKEQVIHNAKQIIKNNPNVHNVSWLVEQLRIQKLPNYSFNYLHKIVRELKQTGQTSC